jgi:hypothetical protein
MRPDAIDTTPPDLAGAPIVSPLLGRAGSTFTVDLVATEPLLEPPTVTLGLVPPVVVPCAGTGGNGYRCSYRATGTENSGRGGVVAFNVWMRDLGRNETVRNVVGALHLDFAAPSLAAPAAVAYYPAPSNPLPAVRRAAAGTTVLLALSADEVLDPAAPPTLHAGAGGAAIPFELVLETLTASGAQFRAEIPDALPDGSYAATVTWTDLAGNVGAVSAGRIEVKTSAPALQVNQGAVTYVRAPWGSVATEDLGGFAIPAGPSFQLAPVDPLSAASTLPAATFQAGETSLAALRVWSDSQRSALLGTATSLPDGRWPRVRLQNVDVPSVWVTGIDDAGNESAPVRLANVEWVATGNPGVLLPPALTVEASGYASETLVPDPEAALTAPALAGPDGVTFLVRAQSAIRRISTDPTSPLQGGSARSGSAVAYDCGRARLVLFGGQDYTGTLRNDTWEWDGRTWANRTTLASPSPRYGHAMAYDAARNRVVLYGGFEGPDRYPAETWEWDGSSWTLVPTAGPEPGGRIGALATYDAGRRRVVMVGGFVSGSGSAATQVWEWDGTRWQGVSAGVPAGLVAMTYDVRRGRVVAYDDGGRVQEYDGAVWRTPAQTGAVPPVRTGCSLVYDAVRQRVVLFGGYANGPIYFRDVREWDGATWRDATPPPGTGPSARTAHLAAFDPVAGRMLVIGGANSSTQLDEAWAWDGSGWEDWTPRGGPIPRDSHGLVYDAARGRTVLFGGYTACCDGSGNAIGTTDVWEWDGRRWFQLLSPAPAPAARYRPMMAFDSAAQRVVLYGGDPMLAGTAPDPGVWEWNGAKWSLRTTAGAPTAPPRNGDGAYDSGRKALVVLGGNANSSVSETWELVPGVTAGTWTWSQKAASPPTGYTYFSSESLLFDGARTLSFFGPTFDPAQVVWQWTGSTWTNVTPAGTAVPTRLTPAACWDTREGRALMFGGQTYRQGGGAPLGDAWEWTGSAFVPLIPPPQSAWPQAVSLWKMAYDSRRGRAVLFGGYPRSAGYAADTPTWEWDREVVATASGPRRKRTPAVQITVSHATAGFSSADVTGLRVRGRAGGAFGTSGAGATLLGWRTGGALAQPGEWVPLASNGDGVPLAAAPAGGIGWTAAPAEVQGFLLGRDARLAFQLRPADRSAPGEPESAVEADFLEVRVRYAPR